jgi:hypothetical protein
MPRGLIATGGALAGIRVEILAQTGAGSIEVR